MVSRGRCACSTCNVEIPIKHHWLNPWQMHDFSKHPPAFAAKAKEEG